MADKLKKLEQGMSDAARSMAGAQNPAGNKLREALGEAQQNELEMHMRQNAQFIRQGYGSSAWVRENSVSLGLNNLRDQLQQAQAANQQSGKPGQGPGGDNGDLEKALARLEAMRSRMQQLAQSQQGKKVKVASPGKARAKDANRIRLQRGNQDGNWAATRAASWPTTRTGTAGTEWATGPERPTGPERATGQWRTAGARRSVRREYFRLCTHSAAVDR